MLFLLSHSSTCPWLLRADSKPRHVGLVSHSRNWDSFRPPGSFARAGKVAKTHPNGALPTAGLVKLGVECLLPAPAPPGCSWR